MFAADCAADRKTDHITAFIESHGREAVERACYFGVESLSVEPAAEVADVRLLPLDAPEIPDTNPLFKADKSIASFAMVPVTGTNDVLMAARARELAEHALRVLRIALRQKSFGLNPQQLRFRLATSYAFADGGGGWQTHDDVAYPLVATLFRFFALEALLGKPSERLKNGPLALR